MKRALLALGGIYDRDTESWYLPDDKEEIADALLQKYAVRYFSRFIPNKEASKL